jgi:hypothetical protein
MNRNVLCRLLIFAFGFNLLSSGHAEEEAPVQKEVKSAQPTTLDLVWPVNTEYRYVWVKERQRVGETVFRIDRVPRDGGIAYVVDSQFRYDREGVSHQARGLTVVSDQGIPLRFEETRTLSGVAGVVSSQQSRIDFEGDVAKIHSQHNGAAERTITREIKLPAETYLYANQAVEHWAIFASRLPAKFEKHRLDLLYPDFDRVLRVSFRFQEEETLKLGKHPLKTRRYEFSAEGGELSGRLWMGEDKRLAQIEFPVSSLRVVRVP